MSFILSSEFSSLVQQHLHDDVQQLALQRHRYPQLSDADFHFLIQQVEGRQRTKDKLPTFAQNADWWYPVRLSCEQCSSEATARYKAALVAPLAHRTLIDLTAGYGVDTFFMSEQIPEVHYIERNADLCAIASHNFAHTRPHIQIHNTTAEHFLSQSPHRPIASSPSRPIASSPHRLIYLDPARRSQSGSKVFRIEDCEPNVINILPTLRTIASTILIKFSPMLDISAALHALGNEWDVHIVAVNGEVKEVLMITGKGEIRAVNILSTKTDIFSMQPNEEKQSHATMADKIGRYIYEPNAAIIKAGAFRAMSERYKIQKLDTHTHLYTSDDYMADFPGRVWQVIDAEVKDPKKQLDTKTKYSILSRNYPLSPDQIRKKYKLKDGDDYYLIAVRHNAKPKLILASRL